MLLHLLLVWSEVITFTIHLNWFGLKNRSISRQSSPLVFILFNTVTYIICISADYQAAKAARRVFKKGGQDEHEKIRHTSGASHCSSEKSVGEFDAAESLIVLSSITSPKDQQNSVANTSYRSLSSSEQHQQQNTIKMEVEEQSNSNLQVLIKENKYTMNNKQENVSSVSIAAVHQNGQHELKSGNNAPIDLSPALAPHAPVATATVTSCTPQRILHKESISGLNLPSATNTKT